MVDADHRDAASAVDHTISVRGALRAAPITHRPSAHHCPRPERCKHHNSRGHDDHRLQLECDGHYGSFNPDATRIYSDANRMRRLRCGKEPLARTCRDGEARGLPYVQPSTAHSPIMPHATATARTGVSNPSVSRANPRTRQAESIETLVALDHRSDESGLST